MWLPCNLFTVKVWEIKISAKNPGINLSGCLTSKFSKFSQRRESWRTYTEFFKNLHRVHRFHGVKKKDLTTEFHGVFSKQCYFVLKLSVTQWLRKNLTAELHGVFSKHCCSVLIPKAFGTVLPRGWKKIITWSRRRHWGTHPISPSTLLIRVVRG